MEQDRFLYKLPSCRMLYHSCRPPSSHVSTPLKSATAFAGADLVIILVRAAMERPTSHHMVVIAMMLALMATAMSGTEAAMIETWNAASCDGGTTFVFDNVGAGCQTFIDQGAIRVSGINADTRVSVHNQRNCQTASMVGQFYGPACSIQGATKLRAVYIDHVP